MMRFLTALVLGLLFAASAPAADAKKLILRWHGQSFFDLETSAGTRVVFDPHAIEEYGRNSLKADLVLHSHWHTDHTQDEVISNREKAKIVDGFKPNGTRLVWNLVDDKLADIHYKAVGTYHDDSQGMERGINTVFIVEVDGLRIVHLGDLGHVLTDDQVRKIGKVDVLMIPVGGVYTINGADAKKVVEQLKPKMYIIPMHCGTKVYDKLLPPTEFLDDQDAKFVRKAESTNRLVIDTDFKTDKPVIVVLGWKQ
jgi:L-ascorbate metabolism protein UlaG (beta-lactamase superfamily)